MRITNNMLVSNMTYNLNGTLQRLEKLQYEAAEGKRFRVPSDDPIGASKSLKFNTDISKVNQYLRNAKDAESWMKETESALKEINEVLKRTYELTNQAANGTNSPEDLQKIRAEIAELKGHVVQIGNNTYAGRSIFTGFKTDKDLLKDGGTYNVNIGLDDGGAPIDEVFVYNIGVAERVSVNTLGNKIFGRSTSVADNRYTDDITAGEKAYLIQMFDDLESALGGTPPGPINPDGIQEALGNVKEAMGQILSVTAEIGAKSNRLKLTQSKLEDQLINLTELLSFNEDVSLPEAVMKLNIEENVYRASLAVGARIIQPSLMDFLR